MSPGAFVYIWRYTIDPGFRTEFLAAYQAKGEWAQLFSRDENYIRTDLLADANDNNSYTTIDYWTSRSARDAFRERYASEFDEVDKKCEQYTRHEVFIGDYVILE